MERINDLACFLVSTFLKQPTWTEGKELDAHKQKKGGHKLFIVYKSESTSME